MANTFFGLVILGAAVALLPIGCSSRNERENPVPFRMTVHDVFYITTLDRVIVTGVIESGSVRPGDKLAVKTSRGTVAVVVQKLEHPKEPEVFEAHAGEDIGLMLQGIRKEQVTSGDVVVVRDGQQ